MKKLTTILSSLAVAAIAVIYFSGCSSTVTPPSGSVSSNVTVVAATITSLTISWSRDPNDTSADTIYVTGGAQSIPVVVVPSGYSAGTVTGLTTGVAYSISIGSPVGRTSPISYTIAGLPTGIMVNSMSATSIGAKWTRGASDVGADTIIAMNGSTVVSTAVATGSTGVVTGLTESTLYTITVHNATTGTTPTINWETAERSTGIKIYEKADPDAGDPSALVLGTNTTGAVSLTGATNADFVLDDGGSSASGISFEAGSVFDGSWNATRVSPVINFVVGGLNSDYRATDYTSDLLSATANSYDIPNDASYTTKGSAVMTCQTADGNLALIEIVPDASGTLYSTTADGYKYITVNVSYQSMSAAPYAGRGHVRNAGLEPRMSAH